MSRVTKQQLILPTILVLAGIEKIYESRRRKNRDYWRYK